MSDVIDLLENIGQNAALRYASADELVRALKLAGASEACTSAVISGDMSLLYAELGQSSTPRLHHQTQGSPWREEEEEKEREEELELNPAR